MRHQKCGCDLKASIFTRQALMPVVRMDLSTENGFTTARARTRSPPSMIFRTVQSRWPDTAQYEPCRIISRIAYASQARGDACLLATQQAERNRAGLGDSGRQATEEHPRFQLPAGDMHWFFWHPVTARVAMCIARHPY
jgi:hypothetical protein